MREKLKNINMPHTYVLLISLMIIVAILSWVIPPGEFTRIEMAGRTVVDPNTFHVVSRNGQGIFDLLKAIPQGFERAQHIAFFLFVTGGSFHIIAETGMIESALNQIVVKLRGYERLVIPVIMLVLGVAGGTIGLSEETIVFIAIGVALARAIGYDAMVGAGFIILGAGVGFSSGFMNPFTVGVAQSIAELPLFSGMALRLAVFITLWIVSSLYVMRYADIVKKNPEKSLVRELEIHEGKNNKESALNAASDSKLTTQQKLVAAVFVIGFIIIAYGVVQLGWYITEIAAVFLGMGILSGFMNKLSAGEVADLFIIGAKDMMFAALVVGLAQSLIVVLENGYMLDTIIYYISNSIAILPSSLAAAAMYVVQNIINFFIGSGSGQAAVTMPIMVPLADAIGVTRQTAVLAFNLGDGFTNTILPMSGTLIACLSIAKIPYSKWLKFAAPLISIWFVIGMIFIFYAQFIGYGLI